MTAKSKVISEKLCAGCGAEIRGGSEFCYNCGEKVGGDFNESMPAETPSITRKREVMGAEDIIEAKVSESTTNIRTKEVDSETATGPGSKARRYSRSLSRSDRKPVEVVWRKKEGQGLGFLILSLVLALIVALTIGLAFYLK